MLNPYPQFSDWFQFVTLFHRCADRQKGKEDSSPFKNVPRCPGKRDTNYSLSQRLVKFLMHVSPPPFLPSFLGEPLHYDFNIFNLTRLSIWS